MKTIKLLNFAFTGLLISFLFLGCTEDFEEMNTNERVLDRTGCGLSLVIFMHVSSTRDSIMDYHQTSQNLFADHYCQYFANTPKCFPF